MLDALADPVFLHDAQHRLLFANRAYLAHAGVPLEAILGRPYWEVFPRQAGPLSPAPESIDNGGEHNQLLVLEDGTVFRSRTYSVRTDDGSYRYSVHILEDISALSFTERSLRQLTGALEEKVQARTAELDRERNFVQAVLDTTAAIVLVLDREGRIVRINRVCEQLGGLANAAVVGRPVWEVYIPTAHQSRIRNLFGQLLARSGSRRVQHTWQDSAGRELVLSWTYEVLRDAEGAVEYVIATGQDVSDHIALETALSAALHEQEALMQAIPDIIYMIDLQRRLVRWNRRLETLTGLSHAQLWGQPATDLIPATQHERLRDAVAHALAYGYAEVELDVIDRNGSPIPHQFNGVPIRDENGQPVGLTGIGRDITERRRLMSELRELASIDYLTRISNRAEFERQLKGELARIGRHSGALSLLMFDIDHFKDVNDRYGHQVGDEVLKDLATLVQDNLRASDLLGRWGGEEFMVLSPDLDLVHATRLAEKLRQTVQSHEFGQVGGVTVSFGVTQYHHGETMDALINRVDQAMYRAKEAGRNRVERS